jgi:hypothetical protein
MLRCALVIAIVFAGGCASSADEHAALSVGPASKVIGVLAFQNERLTIRTSADGPRFDVETTDGRLLSQNLDLAELAIRHAEIYDVYRASYAHAGGDAPYLDGRLD